MPIEHQQFLDGLLSWLTENIDRFDPPQEDEVFDTAPEIITPGRRRKAFGELGLALRLAQRVPALSRRTEVAALRSAWLDYARQRNVFFDARRRLHLIPLMAVALVCHGALDTMPAAARRALQSAVDRRFLDCTERSAWSQLDIAYYLDAAGVHHAFPNTLTLLSRSSLNALTPLVHAQRMDLYALTHLVFHGTDFGASPDRLLVLGEQLQHVRHYASLALATALAEHDWDLTGELLATRLCLGEEADALSRHGAEALVRAQQPGGFLPDLRWLRGIEAASEDERATEEFFAVYHPTLVGFILVTCAMATNDAAGVAA